MKKITVIMVMLSVILPVCAFSQNKDTPAVRKLKPGTAYADIGTFDGWSFWIGYDASFSKNYNPESESYAWVIHFAPEGVYLSLQKGKATYSGVDVNAGFSSFYGMVKSPEGDIITRDYFSDMSGMTFSVSDFSMSAAPAGPLSNLSVGFSSSNTFFRSGSSNNVLNAIQFGTGLSASYALVSMPFPFSVSLGKESSVTAGFYPIISWDIWKSGEDPVDAIIRGLKEMASSESKKFTSINRAYMGKQIARFLETFPLQGKVREFVGSTNGSSEIGQLIKEVGEWKKTGDTKNLPEKLKPNLPPKKIFPLMKSLQSATTAGFETGYKLGYDSTNRTDTEYADCAVEIHAQPGKRITVEVTAEEILALLPDRTAKDLEGVSVVFDNPPETYLSSKKTETAVRLKNGKAVFEFITDTPSPVLLGVRIPKNRATDNKTLELCRRIILFE